MWNYDYFLSCEHIMHTIYLLQSLNDLTGLYLVCFQLNYIFAHVGFYGWKASLVCHKNVIIS